MSRVYCIFNNSHFVSSSQNPEKWYSMLILQIWFNFQLVTGVTCVMKNRVTKKSGFPKKKRLIWLTSCWPEKRSCFFVLFLYCMGRKMKAYSAHTDLCKNITRRPSHAQMLQSSYFVPLALSRNLSLWHALVGSLSRRRAIFGVSLNMNPKRNRDLSQDPRPYNLKRETLLPSPDDSTLGASYAEYPGSQSPSIRQS